MRKQKLINAIRETIIDLKGRKNYLWTDPCSCNCGLLARNICDLSRKELGIMFSYGASGKWGANKVCNLTGKPLQQVYEKLHSCGVTHLDIVHLEELSNPEVLKEIGYELRRGLDAGGFETNERGVKENVIAYFQAWLRILERESTPSEPKEEPEYRFVEKHESIKPLLEKEIILS